MSLRPLRLRSREVTALLVLLVASCAGCSVRQPSSHLANPLGWPAHGLHGVGHAGAVSGVPVVRELGRLASSLGELVDAPALLVEGVVTLRPRRFLEAGQVLVEGTGATVTSLWNLPFFWIPGRVVDLSPEAALVNEALSVLEEKPAKRWRSPGGDAREFVFPRGTRVRAEGRTLIYSVPGRSEVVQAAEENLLWHGLQSLIGCDFPAQERSWGFIVRTRARWSEKSPRQRAVTILHEFYHQQMQMRERFRGWTLCYWPAYQATFPFTGWDGHWAEMRGGMAAGAVDRGLQLWEVGLENGPSAIPAGPGRPGVPEEEVGS